MNDIPEDFDISSYVGCYLTAIDLQQYMFILRFENLDRGLSKIKLIQGLECSGRLDVNLGDGWIQWHDSQQGWLNTSRLTSLFGLEITGWSVESKRTFLLSFEGDVKMKFTGESDQYEDFYFQSLGWVI